MTGVWELCACHALGQHRSVQGYRCSARRDEAAFPKAVINVAKGYRRVGAMLRRAGWLVNDKRVYRIWREEALKVPKNNPERKGFGLMTGAVCG